MAFEQQGRKAESSTRANSLPKMPVWPARSSKSRPRVSSERAESSASLAPASQLRSTVNPKPITYAICLCHPLRTLSCVPTHFSCEFYAAIFFTLFMCVLKANTSRSRSPVSPERTESSASLAPASQLRTPVNRKKISYAICLYCHPLRTLSCVLTHFSCEF